MKEYKKQAGARSRQLKADRILCWKLKAESFNDSVWRTGWRHSVRANHWRKLSKIVIIK